MAPQFVLDLQNLDAAGKALKAPIPVAWLRGALEGCEASSAGEDGTLELRYSKSGTDVILHGHAKLKIQVPCARCMTETVVPLDIELGLMLVPAETARGDFARGRKGRDAKAKAASKDAAKGAGKEASKDAKTAAPAIKGAKEAGKGKAASEPEYEIQTGDAEQDVYEGDEVVVDPFLREAILLEVPPFPLCSESCRGIAPPPSEESTGPTLDPRLAPLLKFKKPGN